MKKSILIPGCLSLVFAASQLAAEEVSISLLSADGPSPIGSISLSDSAYGLVLTPNLKQLTPGVHGFHVHQNGSCDTSSKNGKTVLGGAAGGHFDPDGSGKHGYPGQMTITRVICRRSMSMLMAWLPHLCWHQG